MWIAQVILVSLADVMAVNGFGDVCKLRTQDPENFDEEVKSLVSAWWILDLSVCLVMSGKRRK